MTGARWNLRRRLVAAFLLLGLLVALGAGVSAVTVGRVDARSSQVTGRLFATYDAAAQRFQSLLDQETAVRGYALSGQEEFLGSFESGQRAEADQLARLRELATDEPTLRSRLADVDAAVLAWRAGSAEPLVARVRLGGQSQGQASALLTGKQLFDEVRARSTDFQDEIVRQRQAAISDLLRAERILVGVIVAAGLLLLVAGVVLWRALAVWVTTPLDRLGKEVGAVAGGDLDHLVSVSGPPEVTSLALEVEHMRRRLRATSSAALAAQQDAEVARTALEGQAVELRRSNDELEQFAYVASHDLQEPLRKVASFCQLLERRYKGQLDERADDYIAYAVDGAKRMQVLINDLLAFSRVGRTSSGREAVDLDDLLARAVRNLDAAIEESEAVVTHDDLPVLAIDPSLVTQLLQNLVGNAVKYRSNDAAPRIHVGADLHDDAQAWEFRCSDNGIGIEAAYADKVFVIFQRLHPKADYSGTGIGLALCKKIVEYHGGRIWLDEQASGPGLGTTIRWTLPALPVEAAGGGGEGG